MNRQPRSVRALASRRLGALCALVLGYSALALGQSAAPAPPPALEDLGNQRYRIGKIIVDKSSGKFTVAARVLVTDGPLEYVAVGVGGVKAYESLLEVEASALEFNLACILIGLTTDNVVAPKNQFDPSPAIGPRVHITAIWGQGRTMVRKDVGKLIAANGKPAASDDWVYIGSFHNPVQPKSLMAEQVNTLVSFVHDPFALIDHHAGVGIGNYGSIVANVSELPPADVSMSLEIAADAAASN
jgi:hypothetical protein